MSNANNLPRIHVRDRSDTDYPEYCGVISKNGLLYLSTFELPQPATFDEAETRFLNECEDGVTPEAVVLFTHTPYADPDGVTERRSAIDYVLEEVSSLLGKPYATD